jgi:hypothetical protein
VFLVARVALRPSDGGLNSIIAGIPSKVGLPVLGQQEMWIESMTLPRKLKAHPGRGKVSECRLTRRGVLTIRTAAVRHLTATLRGGAFTRRTRKGALKFKLTTIDASRRRVHQTVKARR